MYLVGCDILEKYVKVVDGLKSNAGGFEYKIDEVNETDNWHPETMDGKEIGGFSFSVEEKLIRWIIRGDTLYYVFQKNLMKKY